MDTHDTFTGRFRWLMAVADLRQSGVARVTGLSPKAVEFFSSGRRDNPTAETAMAIAGAFGVSLDWLLAGVGPVPDEDHVRRAVAAAQDPTDVAPDVPERVGIDRSADYDQTGTGD